MSAESDTSKKLLPNDDKNSTKGQSTIKNNEDFTKGQSAIKNNEDFKKEYIKKYVAGMILDDEIRTELIHNPNPNKEKEIELQKKFGEVFKLLSFSDEENTKFVTYDNHEKELIEEIVVSRTKIKNKKEYGQIHTKIVADGYIIFSTDGKICKFNEETKKVTWSNANNEVVASNTYVKIGKMHEHVLDEKFSVEKKMRGTNDVKNKVFELYQTEEVKQIYNKLSDSAKKLFINFKFVSLELHCILRILHEIIRVNEYETYYIDKKTNEFYIYKKFEQHVRRTPENQFANIIDYHECGTGKKLPPEYYPQFQTKPIVILPSNLEELWKDALKNSKESDKNAKP